MLLSLPSVDIWVKGITETAKMTLPSAVVENTYSRAGKLKCQQGEVGERAARTAATCRTWALSKDQIITSMRKFKHRFSGPLALLR